MFLNGRTASEGLLGKGKAMRSRDAASTLGCQGRSHAARPTRSSSASEAAAHLHIGEAHQIAPAALPMEAGSIRTR
jgi:hypothetical protein